MSRPPYNPNASQPGHPYGRPGQFPGQPYGAQGYRPQQNAYAPPPQGYRPQQYHPNQLHQGAAPGGPGGPGAYGGYPPASQASPYARYGYATGPPTTAPSPAGSPSPAPGSGAPTESVLDRLKRAFPDMPEKTLATAVRTRKTYEDSLRWLKQMQERKLMPSQPAQPVAHNPKQSIRQKFSHLAYEQRQGAHQPMMGPQMMHPGMMGPQMMHQGMPQMMGGMPQMMPPGMAPGMGPGGMGPGGMGPGAMGMMPQMMGPGMAGGPVPIQRPQRRALEDDESEDEMSDSDDYDPQEAAEFDARVLEFLNTAAPEAIADVATQPMESVQVLVKKRPFASLAQAGRVDIVPKEEQDERKRRRGAARKSIGLKIIDATRTTLRGYEAVDSLIKECSRLGKVVQRGIAAWKLNEDALADDKLEAEGPTFFKEQPALLSEGTVLKNYQQVGINWLQLLYNDKLSCILADEMGLGKTLQVIAFLAHLKERGEPGPHLVVCPASTLENWLRELAKFWPTGRVEAYYGGQPERREIREDILERPDSFDVMVTTYNLATGQKADVGFLKSMGFNVVVYDEGHLLKNSQSERYNKLMKLRAKFRVLLTGTPLQNNLRELVSLLSFILPRLFTENRDDLLEVFKFKAKATTGESEKSRDELLSEQRIRKAKTMMQPFILRRRKEQVLKYLPPKSHEVEFCDMTDAQRVIYENELKRNRKEIRTAKNEVDTSTSGPKKAQKAAGKQLDNVLMQLRKAALHPLLFREIYTDAKLKKMARMIMDEDVYKEANQTYIFEDMQVMNDFELDRLCRKFPVILGEFVLADEHYLDSGKAQKLKKMLTDMLALDKPVEERPTEGDRVLLFSQFTLMLDILQRVLDVMGVKYLRMDGQTPVEARQDMIDQYHEDKDIKVFLLSTKAGGFGINLAVANKVIIFDLSFNPHDDKQAEDRAHRVGQTRPVEVTRLITRGTIEENILDLANTKLALDKQVSEDTGLDEEDEIDTEKEAYVANQLLGDGNDDDEEDEEAPAAESNGDAKEEPAEEPEETPEPPAPESTEEPEEPAPRARRRGRPAKHVEVSDDDDESFSDDDEEEDLQPRKTRRLTRRR